MTATTITTRTTATRPASPAVRIARAAIVYARARRAVSSLPRKADADRAARLFAEMERAEDELLETVTRAGDKVPGDK